MGVRLDDLWEINEALQYLVGLGYSPQQELLSRSSSPSASAPDVHQWQVPTIIAVWPS